MADKILPLAVGRTATGAVAGVRIDVKPGKEQVPVHIRGITTATVSIDGSLDGTNWLSLTSKTADFIGLVPAFPYMRANVTAYTSGTIHVNLWADRAFGS